MITPTCAPSLFTCSRTSRATRSLVLLGLGSMGLALPVSGMAEGFIDDTKATLNLRNAYINRNYTNPDYPQSKAEEWTQNFILDVKSGFTQGTVGFGVDVLGLYSQKLDGGKGTVGTQLLPTHSDGEPADNFGRLGVAAKAKISNTELKIGEWMPVLPILRSDDGRSLPQTFRGGQITSKEIAGLNLRRQFGKRPPDCLQRRRLGPRHAIRQHRHMLRRERHRRLGGEVGRHQLHIVRRAFQPPALLQRRILVRPDQQGIILPRQSGQGGQAQGYGEK